MVVNYVRVYANCRLRKLWFSDKGGGEVGGGGEGEEMGLYAA